MRLCLEAFQDDLPALFLLENVLRIKTRGDRLLKEIKRLLTKYGYVPDDPAGGNMQRLQWKNWVRPALILAGGEWKNWRHYRRKKLFMVRLAPSPNVSLSGINRGIHGNRLVPQGRTP
ncbi:hypothetical protein [Brevibacillus thermoruber]|uniref:hypothetical protein n=1 Tax=Brevibacillus thermoruber TaxID=33942 RepID=UPI00055665DA|nr:hypothetical protein [Brevibacillus thermoruber]